MRIPEEVARRVRDGHPWIFEDALQGRRVTVAPPAAVDVVDADGRFVGRAVAGAEGALVLRVFSRERGANLDVAHVRRVVARAAGMRRRLLDLGPESCFRVLGGDAEGLPAVTVDAYGAYLVISLYASVADHWLEPLVAALVAEWRPLGVYVQRRYEAPPAGRARPGATLVAGSAAPPEVAVAEGRLRFAVDVTAPLGTGLFADMRLGRAAVGRLSPGRSVLNCFSYAGAFSVVAAAHGARSVTSVDAASKAHGRARRNLELNGLREDDGRHTFVTGDAFATLARLADRRQRFDLVILDPPTFSTAKGKTFTAIKDYAELTTAALAVLERPGLLFCACNASKVSAVELDRALARGAADAGRDLVAVERVGQPPDFPSVSGFPESNYLKIVVGWAA